MKNKGSLIILSGPSGVGKDTVRNLLDDEKLNIAYSVSMTTRSPRPGEKEGIDYFFVSPEEFKKAIKDEELLEYTNFVGNYYGTPKKEVSRLLENGKNVLLQIEVDGAAQVIQRHPETVSIFLLPPSIEELERRIRNRKTEKDEIIQKRLAEAKQELAHQDMYQYLVVNDEPEKAAQIISDIILAA